MTNEKIWPLENAAFKLVARLIDVLPTATGHRFGVSINTKGTDDMLNFIQRHRRVAIAIAATLDVLLVAAAVTLIVMVV